MRVRFSIDYMATPLHKNPCPGGHEIFLDRFLVIIIIHLVCMDHAPEKRRRFFFLKYIYFTLFTQILPPFEVGGHEIYSFLSPYHSDAT